ncbi:MAG: hypothetical protein ACR2K3_03815 [Nocardioides sp.]
MPGPRFACPPPLTVAASLVAVQGLLLLAYAVLEAVNTHADRVALAVTTALFFALYGAALVIFAWSITRGRGWARSPIVLSQVIWLGIAWNFRGGSSTGVAIALAVVAVIVLVGVLHPSSVDALADDRSEGTP